MTALTILDKMREKGLDGAKTLRKLTLMFQLAQLTLNLADEVESDFKSIGTYRMADKVTLKQLHTLLYRFLRDLYPNLTQEQLDDMIGDLDELESLTKNWAKL